MRDKQLNRCIDHVANSWRCCQLHRRGLNHKPARWPKWMHESAKDQERVSRQALDLLILYRNEQETL